METNTQIGAVIREMENNYVNGTTTISKYVSLSMYDEINQIDAYLNSKHISGERDSQDREKPFFNICIASRNIWFRSTDLDRKNIRIRATKRSDVIKSFLANVKLQEWMDKANFGQFLNDWGIGLAGYGSYVSKFVEQDGELYCMPISWNRLICDPVDFNSNPKIEILELTPAQLKQKKGYDKEIVKKLVSALSSREGLDRQQKDNNANFIKLYEIHGNLPLSFITGKEEDEETYTQQMQVVSFVEGKNKGEFDDYVLIKGREDKDPYMKTDTLTPDGYTLATGSVKSLFESQWMMNHTVKSIKDQLDLASKLVFQTSDGSFVGQNVLSSIENGDIMITTPNNPLTQVNNNSHDITSLQAYGNQWKALGNEVTGISEQMLGGTPPSGTAWRQTEAILQENYSLFDKIKQNKGLAIEQMMRLYIIPYIKKQLDTTKEVVATLDSYGIDKIDEMYMKNEPIRRTNKRIIDKVLQAEPLGQLPTGEMEQEIMGEESLNVASELEDMGNQRFFKPSEEKDKTWKDLFKDFEWEAKVEITNENSNKEAVLTTLNSVFQTIANPMASQVLQTPQGKLVFNSILRETGVISEMEISGLKTSPQPSQQLPQELQIK